MYTAKFRGLNEYVFNEYIKSSDAKRIDQFDYHELFKMVGIEKDIDSRDWFGSISHGKGRITRVEILEYGNVMITVKVTGIDNSNYGPIPSDICKGKGVWYPISYCVES